MGVLRENKEKLLTVLEVGFYKNIIVIMIFYSLREERKQNNA